MGPRTPPCPRAPSQLCSRHSQAPEAASVLFTETQKSPSRGLPALLIHSRVFNRTKFRVSSAESCCQEEAHGSFCRKLVLGGKKQVAPGALAAGRLGLAARLGPGRPDRPRAGSPDGPPAVSSWDPRADRGLGHTGCIRRQQGPQETPLQPHQPWAEAGPSPRGYRGPHPRPCSRCRQGQRAACRPWEVSAGQESGPHLINRLNRGHKPGTQAATSAGEGGAEGRDVQRGPSPRRPPGRTSSARKADARPGRAAGRCPLGPWAAARRCSQLTTVLHPEPPQTELPSEASSPSRPRLPGWQPVCALVQSLPPHGAAAPATRLPPHHKPPGCGPPFHLPVWVLDAGHPGSSGPQDGPRLVTRMRPGLQS